MPSEELIPLGKETVGSCCVGMWTLCCKHLFFKKSQKPRFFFFFLCVITLFSNVGHQYVFFKKILFEPKETHAGRRQPLDHYQVATSVLGLITLEAARSSGLRLQQTQVPSLVLLDSMIQDSEHPFPRLPRWDDSTDLTE